MHPRHRPTVPAWAISVVVGVVAFVARFAACGGIGGLRDVHGYDDGVYFAGAVALAHGRLPYADFWFLHPPGALLALAPFGAATHVVPDADALVAARLAVMVLGAASAVLLTRIARPWGPVATAVAGLLYALWPAAVLTERLTYLEPLGVVALVAAVHAIQTSRRPGTARWWSWSAGLWLGFALTVKIWNVVPVAVVLAWCLIVGGWRLGRRVLAVTAGTALAVVVPFAAVGGEAMWRMVVLDQLGRGRAPVPAPARLAGILGADRGRLSDVVERPGVAVVVAVVLVVAALTCVVARRGRLWVALALAQGVTVALSPSYFAHYAATVAPALVMVLAAGCVSLADLGARVRGLRLRAAVLPALALAPVVALVAPLPGDLRHAPRFPVAEIEAQLPGHGCVQADSPVNLVLLDLLSRDLDRGCEQPVDVSGRAYEIGPRTADGSPSPRVRNPQWQEEILRYLTSGTAAVLTRGVGNGFSPETASEVERRTVWESGNARVVAGDGFGP